MGTWSPRGRSECIKKARQRGFLHHSHTSARTDPGDIVANRLRIGGASQLLTVAYCYLLVVANRPRFGYYEILRVGHQWELVTGGALTTLARTWDGTNILGLESRQV